jgi:hypothetical protein
MLRVITTFNAIVLALAVGANAVSLEKRHQLSLKLGMWNQITNTRVEVGLDGVETSVESSGLLGGLAYGNWLQENLALTFCIEGMALEISTDAGVLGVVTETSAVSLMQLGLKYYFIKSTLVSTVRPYFKGSAGPMTGTQSSSRVGLTVVNEERTEYAFGGQIGCGVDFVTSRHFMMGIGMGYNLMSDFGEPIGGSRNYSGPEFGFEFSWLFGKGIE